MTTTTLITVRANPDLDDCLQGAVDEYIAAHPEVTGWDLAPRWADETRESVVLTVPDLPPGTSNAVVDCMETLSAREPEVGELLRAVGAACNAVAHGDDNGCVVYVQRARLREAREAIRAVGWDLGVRYNPHDARNNIGDRVAVTVTRSASRADFGDAAP